MEQLVVGFMGYADTNSVISLTGLPGDMIADYVLNQGHVFVCRRVPVVYGKYIFRESTIIAAAMISSQSHTLTIDFFGGCDEGLSHIFEDMAAKLKMFGKKRAEYISHETELDAQLALSKAGWIGRMVEHDEILFQLSVAE